MEEVGGGQDGMTEKTLVLLETLFSQIRPIKICVVVSNKQSQDGLYVFANE